MSNARFIIRWDDISPYQDQGKFRALVDLFVRYSIPALLGVIPDNQDSSIKFTTVDEHEYVDRLKELDNLGWEIALHGYQHRKITDNGGILQLNRASEFAGRNLDDQLADIQHGKRILNDYGFDPKTFIPPWHAYDNATIDALGQTGFGFLSDGIFLYPRKIGDLVQLPVIFWSVPGQIKTLHNLGSIYTICIHPHLVTDNDYARLELFFREVNPEVMTPVSLEPERKTLVKSSIKKKITEALFGGLYRKQK